MSAAARRAGESGEATRRSWRLAAAAVGMCAAVGLLGAPATAMAGGRPATRLASAPKPYDQLLAVSCPARRVCVAVGITDLNQPTLLAERWNGRRWSLTHPALPAGATLGGLTGVSCSSARACMAVGYDSGGPLAERSNGRSWTVQVGNLVHRGRVLRLR
jgi:hypothetical protein